MAAARATLQYVIEDGDDLVFYYSSGTLCQWMVEDNNEVIVLAGMKLPERQGTLGEEPAFNDTSGRATKVSGLTVENRAFFLEQFPQLVKSAGKT